jgi:hypothetical protein
MPATKTIKMVGPTTWAPIAHIDRGQIRSAFLHDKQKLVINLEQGKYKYGATLDRRDGDTFYGEWSCTDGGVTYTGAASAQLYHSQNGNELLFGDWSEGGDRYYWWAELCIDKHFRDEDDD